MQNMYSCVVDIDMSDEDTILRALKKGDSSKQNSNSRKANLEYIRNSKITT